MLSVEHLGKAYGATAVLTDVSFTVAASETVGLVGTSGAGKTTIARCVAGQERPGTGTVRWDGRAPDRRTRRRAVQTVFQDPRSSLDPRWTVRRSLAEPVDHWDRHLDRAARRTRVAELLDLVGLPAEHLDRYPHELSTGQCQRVCIARALAPGPRLLLLDEPLSALDLPVQAQMLDLLRDIQREQDVGYLFISHDIVVVAQLCTRILVLDGGRIVEEAAAGELLTNPRHPHTRALVADTPMLRRTRA